VKPDKQLEQNLHLLAIFHYVVAGFLALMVCFSILYAAFAWNMFSSFPVTVPPFEEVQVTTYEEYGQAISQEDYDERVARYAAPEQIFAGFRTMMITILLLNGLFWGGICLMTALSGYFIQQRQRRVFSIVTAAVNCIYFPFGTVLGVFTIILLNKSETIDLYNAKR
jgi:hypothetical protein